MNSQQIKSILESTFAILANNIEIDEDGRVIWSVEVLDENELDRLYDILYSMEPLFNKLGGELIMQDDHEYFGGMVS